MKNKEVGIDQSFFTHHSTFLILYFSNSLLLYFFISLQIHRMIRRHILPTPYFYRRPRFRRS